MTLKRHTWTATLVLLLASSPAFAQTSVSEITPHREPMVDKWLAGLKETDQKLRSHDWEGAAKRARRAGEEIVDLAGTGESPAYSLAVVAVFRAIAEAELGNQDEAEWFWDSALNLFPDVAKTDLSPYGQKALELRRRTLRDFGKENWNTVDGRTVDPPRIVRQTRPEFPKALSLLGAEGRVVVASVIGADGRPRQPVILEAQGKSAGLKYIVLETVRQWRFAPARLDGKPVPVSYVLTVTFQQQKK